MIVLGIETAPAQVGIALVDGCDSPPLSSSCVSAICAADDYCCTTSWDSICVGAVDDVCGANCE